MPVNPLKVHTYSIRRPKSEMKLIREVARRLGTSPTALMTEAWTRRFPSLLKKAGMSRDE